MVDRKKITKVEERLAKSLNEMSEAAGVVDSKAGEMFGFLAKSRLALEELCEQLGIPPAECHDAERH